MPDKGGKISRNTVNSCSTRNSPFSKLKFKTIDFNSTLRVSEERISVQSSVKKSLRKKKVVETLHSQVSITD
jgi:hypothetical protein